MSLAVIVRSDEQRDRPGRIEPDFRGFHHPAVGRLDGAGDADAAQLAARPGLLPARGEPRVVGCLQAVLHVPEEIPGVVGVDQSRLERHRVGGNGIAPPQLGGIDGEFPRRLVHERLDHVGRFGPARAAVVARQHGVRQHARDLDVDGRRRIDARQDAEVLHRRTGVAVRCIVGAAIGERAHAQREEAPVAIQREFRVADVVAPVLVGEQAFAALADPLDRAAEQLRRDQGERVLGIAPALHSEPPSHVLRYDAQLRLGYMENLVRQQRADPVRRLHRAVDGVAILGAVVLGQTSARLHAVRGNAGDHQPVAHHMGGVRERRVHRRPVPEFVKKSLVVGAGVPDRRRARRDRVGGAGHRGQRLVVHLDQFGRILRLEQGFGHHESHRVPDVAHALTHQVRLRADERRGSVAALARHTRALQAQAPNRRVLAREHQQHAGCGLRAARVDGADRRVSMRRSQNVSERLAEQRNVVHVPACPLEQPGVFLPAHRLTYSKMFHCPFLFRIYIGADPARSMQAHAPHCSGAAQASSAHARMITGPASMRDLHKP